MVLMFISIWYIFNCMMIYEFSYLDNIKEDGVFCSGYQLWCVCLKLGDRNFDNTPSSNLSGCYKQNGDIFTL